MLNFCQFLLSINIVNLVFQVYRAVDACKSVLRGLHDSKIAQRELDRVNISSLTSYFTLLHTHTHTSNFIGFSTSISINIENKI